MNQLKTIVFMGVLAALVVGVGYAVAPGSLPVFLVLAAVMNLGAYFFSDRIVLAMSRAREVAPGEAPRLHAIVGDLAAQAGIPKPRVYVMEEPGPNAFATGRNPRHAVVAVTTGLLQIMDERELRGVLAHELAHVKNRDVLIASLAAALASVITYAANALMWTGLLGGRSSDDEEGSGAGGLLFMILGPIAATLIQMAISRQREYQADASAATLTGDPGGLAHALRKLHVASARIPSSMAPTTASLCIVNPFGSVRSVANLFSTHPPIEERIRRLEERVTVDRHETRRDAGPRRPAYS